MEIAMAASVKRIPSSIQWLATLVFGVSLFVGLHYGLADTRAEAAKIDTAWQQAEVNRHAAACKETTETVRTLPNGDKETKTATRDCATKPELSLPAKVGLRLLWHVIF
jgi:hypothetical protein